MFYFRNKALYRAEDEPADMFKIDFYLMKVKTLKLKILTLVFFLTSRESQELKGIMDYFYFVLESFVLIHNFFLQSSGQVASGCEHLLQCFKFPISADTTGQHTQGQQVLVC